MLSPKRYSAGIDTPAGGVGRGRYTYTVFGPSSGNDLPLPLRLIVQELCESRGGRPELSVLTSLLVSVDVKIY